MKNPIRIIFLFTIIAFSCSKSIVTDQQKRQFCLQQKIFQDNKDILVKAAETINKKTLCNELIEMPLDDIVIKNNIELSKIEDLLYTLSTFANVLENSNTLDKTNEKLLVSQIQQSLEMLDLNIKSGFAFSITKIDTTRILEKGNDTLILK